MPTIGETRAPHQHRQIAESFGADADRYDRTRPRYPAALVERIVAAAPGRDFVDAGIGTGIAARQFRAAGCRVLGVEVDPRMAELARRQGFGVEVAAFEDWRPAGRTFDAVVSGQTWHWVDPLAGAARAAEALAARGLFAAFWNVAQPEPELAEAFAAVHREVTPDLPYVPWSAPALDAYGPILANAIAGLRETGAFGEPEQWRCDWECAYTRDEWLDQLPTHGGHSRLPRAAQQALLAGIGAAVDAAGGRFTMRYAAVAVTATRNGRVPECLPTARPGSA